MAGDRIRDLPLISTATPKRATLFEVEQDGVSEHATISMLLLNYLNSPGVLSAPAASTDADDNPTPNTTDYPPANYPEGTLFFATSYPSPSYSGGMIFRREGAAGSEKWVWKYGSFYQNAGAGNVYQRDADGTQICWFRDLSNLAVNFTARTEGNFSGYIFAETWTFPIAFVDANIAVQGQAYMFAGSTNSTISGVHPDGDPSATSIIMRFWASIDVDSIHYRNFTAIGRWK